MKNIIALLVVFGGIACAQNLSEPVHVPLSDPSRPARLRAHVLTGSIFVRGSTSAKEVVVEMRPHARASHGRDRDMEEAPTPPTPPTPPGAAGMHRLDFGSHGIDVTEQDNVVNVKTTPWGQHDDLVITVPRRCSLELKTLSGGKLSVEDVEGEIDLDALNGAVDVKNVSGSVLAHSLNGEITVTMDRVDGTKPMSFSTLNGTIDVTLPDSVRANVRMKTDNGEVYSDFDVKLDTGTHLSGDSGTRRDGVYRFHMDRTLRGTINGGGPEIQFTSFNGNIFIRKRK